jgi:dTDP-3-amino-3,4,6-trideoxy-alpha-D-glucose transaminase
LAAPVVIPFLDLSRKAARYRAELDAAIARVLDRGRFILGPEVEAFETEVAAAFGARFAVGVANGTEALELILRARGIGGGSEVVLPAVTSPFTALAVLAAGATAVVADVDPETLLLDPESVAQASDGRTRAVVPVHLYGRVLPQAGMDVLYDSGLEIIQDAAHAHGATLRFDHPAAFSFYPTKNLGAFGDGGAVLTDNENLAALLRQLRNGGRGQDAVVTDEGINSRLDEIQAAILRVFLAALPEDQARRRQIAQRYAEVRPPVGGMPETEGEHSFHLYVIRDPHRDALRERLKAAGVETAVHYPVPMHRQPLFRVEAGFTLPHAERACQEILSLPLNADMTDAEVDAVCQCLSE